MQGGDISNEVAPRLVVVFEGLLGLLPTPKDRAAEGLARKLHRWGRAVATYEINETMARVIWDITWRRAMRVEVVTFLGESFANSLEDRLDRENLPIGRVWATEPHLLARQIAYMPDLAAIYDPDPTRRFTYGSKGRLMTPDATTTLGLF